MHRRIAGFDDVVFIGRVRTAAMSGAEMPGGQIDRRSGEDIARPGTGEAAFKVAKTPGCPSVGIIVAL